MGRRDKKEKKLQNQNAKDKEQNSENKSSENKATPVTEASSENIPNSAPKAKTSAPSSPKVENIPTSSTSQNATQSKCSAKIRQGAPVVKKELSKIISDHDSKDSLNLLENLLKMYEKMDGSTSKLTEEIKRIAANISSEAKEDVKKEEKTETVVEECVKEEAKQDEVEHCCSFCDKLAVTRCTGCRLVFYCDRECQKMDWKSHKDICRPYAIGKRKGMGRLLIASRDLAADELIIKESALIIGPNQITEPLCLSCYRSVDGSYRCSKCSWPMCSKECENSAADQEHKYECDITTKCGLQITIDDFDSPNHLYEVVTVLRCLGFANIESKRWRSVVERFNVTSLFPGSNGKNANDESGFDRSAAIRTLKNDFKLGFAIPNPVDMDATLNNIFNLVQRNHVPTKLSYGDVQGLYPMTSLLSHSCVPNTKIRWDSAERGVTVSATESIKKGDPITTIYTDILWGTRARREHLRQTRFISCSCKRCQDPTERGTNFSTLLCQRCPKNTKKSLLLPTNSLDDEAPWECNQCHQQIASSEVVQKTLALGAEVSEALVDPSVESLERVLKKWSSTFHQNHYHLHALNHSLLQLYAREQEKVEEQDDRHWEQLTKKEKACKDFLTVCSQLDPSLANTTTFIGLTFFEYHKPILQCAKRNFGLGKLTTEQLKKRMFLAKALLKKAMDMFKDEPEDTPEGRLFLTCKEECTSIAKWMMAVQLV